MLLERYAELLRLVEGMQRDFERFALKQNRRAGIRLRKQLQELRRLAKEIRQEIQQVRRTFRRVRSGVGTEPSTAVAPAAAPNFAWRG
jgi:uncharacterized membrane protein